MSRSIFLITIIVTLVVFAGEIKTVEAAENYEFQIEGTRDSSAPTVQLSPTSFIDALYIWMLGIVGLAALFAIVIGGVQYIVSGAVESTKAARRWITNALLGLLLAGLSWLILRTINPELVRQFNIEQYIQQKYNQIRK